MPLSPEEKADLARQNAQCLLLNNLGYLQQEVGLVRFPVKRQTPANLPNQGNNVYGRTTGVVCYLGQPDDLVNALTQDKEKISTFVHATHAQLSLLQPKLEFYIRSNTVDPRTNTVTPFDRPVYFSDFTKGETVKKLGRIRSGEDEVLGPNDGLNVGITEFSWNFDNKHEGDRVIKARLNLYFGSLAELTSQYYLDFLFADGKRSVYQPSIESTEEKIKNLESSLQGRKQAIIKGEPTGRARSNRLRDSQQLKVVVGWQRPDRAVPELFDNKQQQEDFYDAVETFQQVLILNITQYDIQFNQNGSVEVVVEYIASTDAVVVSPEADILGSQDTVGFIPLEVYSTWEEMMAALGLAGEDGPVHGSSRHKNVRKLGAFENLYVARRFQTARALGYNQGPKGIIKPPELGGDVDAFMVNIDAVKAELEYLKDWMELYDLKGANKVGGSTSVNAKKREQAKTQFDAVAEGLDAALDQAKRQKYSNFLNDLMGANRIFRAEAEFKDVAGILRTGGNPPKYVGLKSANRSHLHDGFYGVGGDFLQAKIQRLATVGTESQTAVDEEDLYKVLDPSVTYDEYAANTTPGASDTRAIYYLRLGDIVQTAAKNAGISMEHLITFGSFDPMLAQIPFNGGVMSLAEIPISIDYFGQWFYDHIIAADRSQYAFRRFLDDILNSLVAPMLNTLCTSSRNFSLGYTLYTVDAQTFIDKTGSGAFVQAGASLSTAPGLLQGEYFTVAGGAATQLFVEATRAAAKKALYKRNNQMITLILIHAEQVNEVRRGFRNQDEEDGIYHFFIGTDRGIAQEFNFSKKQMPQLRAMNIEKVNQGASKAGILILPMDVSIDMFGNGLLRNGNMIFVNADYGLGSRVADSLALGGYYRVYKSTHTIRPGEYTTTVDCIFERPRNFPNG